MSTTRLLALALLMTGLTVPVAMPREHRVATVGLLVFAEHECGNEPLRSGLRELGYLEGGNYVIDCRHAGGRFEDLQAAADALVRARPDLIVALTQLTAAAAQRATRRIPIVFIATGDPVFSGFAASLAHPGGTMTGLTCYAGELNAKRLELLKAVAPGIRRIAVLASPRAMPSVSAVYLRDLTAAAASLDLDIRVFEPSGDALESAFDALLAWPADALYILPSIVFAYEAQQIADLAHWHRLPTMHWYKPFVTMGGLMAYGIDYPKLQRRAAGYVDQILKGSNPADLPIEQPMQYELVINRATATELGLTPVGWTRAGVSNCACRGCAWIGSAVASIVRANPCFVRRDPGIPGSVQSTFKQKQNPI